MAALYVDLVMGLFRKLPDFRYTVSIDMPVRARHVALVLAELVGEDGSCTVGTSQISWLTGMQRATVRAAVKEFSEPGLLIAEERNTNEVSSYVFVRHELEELQSKVLTTQRWPVYALADFGLPGHVLNALVNQYAYRTVEDLAAVVEELDETSEPSRSAELATRLDIRRIGVAGAGHLIEVLDKWRAAQAN